MEIEKIIEITENVENKSNKDLTMVELELSTEFEKTKELILDFFIHGENISLEEIKKQIKKWHSIDVSIDQIKAIKQVYID